MIHLQTTQPNAFSILEILLVQFTLNEHNGRRFKPAGKINHNSGKGNKIQVDVIKSIQVRAASFFYTVKGPGELHGQWSRVKKDKWE